MLTLLSRRTALGIPLGTPLGITLGGLAALATLAGGVPARPAAAAGADGGLGRLRERSPRPALPEHLAFQDADGTPTEFEAFRGRPLVVNFWATWCAPCVAEMPSLDRLARLVAPAGIEVLCLSSDRGGRPVVERFYQTNGIRGLGIWLDPRGAAGRALGVRGLPTTLLVDREGLEAARLEGEAQWDHPQVVAAVRRLLAPAPAVATPRA